MVVRVRRHGGGASRVGWGAGTTRGRGCGGGGVGGVEERRGGGGGDGGGKGGRDERLVEHWMAAEVRGLLNKWRAVSPSPPPPSPISHPSSRPSSALWVCLD